MKIQPYLDKLNNSKEFQNFKSKNPEAYMSAGFFVLDFAEKKHLHQIDYYNPKSKDMATFALDSKIEMKKAQPQNKKIPEQITEEINLDLDTLKGLVQDEMKNNTITSKLQKIIAIVQKVDGKLVWNLNCITTDMGIIKVHIDDKTHSILKFEKVNLFDIVKKI